MKLPAGTIFTIFGLALGIWALCYVTGVPLSPEATAVVVGLCTVFVLAVKWIWRKLRLKGRAK